MQEASMWLCIGMASKKDWQTVAWAKQTHEENHKQALEESGLHGHDLWVFSHTAKEQAKEKETFEKETEGQEVCQA